MPRARRSSAPRSPSRSSCRRRALIYAGAGTSGRLAVQDGAELMPTFSWPPDRLLLLMAGGEEAMVRSVEGAEDEIEQAARFARESRIRSTDVLIAVAASGTTPFTLACLREGKTARRADRRHRQQPRHADPRRGRHPIWLDTGAEPIAGSTRMKAGTAQRIALNLLSSLVMIRLGHVYEGLMVDLQASTPSWSSAAKESSTQLTGRSREAVRDDALARTRGNVKAALLVLEGCDPGEVSQSLDRAAANLARRQARRRDAGESSA